MWTKTIPKEVTFTCQHFTTTTGIKLEQQVMHQIRMNELWECTEKKGLDPCTHIFTHKCSLNWTFICLYSFFPLQSPQSHISYHLFIRSNHVAAIFSLFIQEDLLVSSCKALAQIHCNNLLIFYACLFLFIHFFQIFWLIVCLTKEIDSAPLRRWRGDGKMWSVSAKVDILNLLL